MSFDFSRTPTFDDDEPLPTHPPPPPPLQPNTLTATITTFTELPAIAAASSPSNFPILIRTQAPPPSPTQSGRAPIDLVAVLDISGSMRGHKLALLKRAVHFIIHTLSPADRLSIITFSTLAHRLLNLSCMSPTGRLRAIAAVDSLIADGWTNIKDGLQTGVHVLNHRRFKNAVSGIILLSDGQDNRSTHTQFGSAMHRPVNQYSYLLPTNTYPTHTFGFGADHDPRALHAIATASGGTFSFIDVEEEIQDAFAMCIGGLLSTVAQEVELMLSTASNGVLITSLAAGIYRSTILNHGLAAVVKFGDLYADEEKDFLVYTSVPVGDGRHTMPLLTVNCSYKNPLTGETVHVKGETAMVNRPESLSGEDTAVNLIVDGQRNRILVGESIKEAQERAEREDLEGAKAVLSRRREAVLESPSGMSGDGLCGWLDMELQEVQNRMDNMGIYKSSGRAYALSGMSSHMQQRASPGASAGRAQAFVFNGLQRQAGQDGVFGASVRPASSIGYQTRSMQDMVARSQNYALQNPSGLLQRGEGEMPPR